VTNLTIYCADIGSVRRGNFGWARLSTDSPTEPCVIGSEMGQLASSVATDLNCQRKVALGFECPLFVPISDDPVELTSARPGEGNRAWCAGAGAGSLATGLTQTFWVLERIRLLTKEEAPLFFDWQTFQGPGTGLFVWEAFVTGKAKAGSHRADAETAVMAFYAGLPNPETLNAIKSTKVRSLIGAALLQSGWTIDIDCLGKACLVVRS
jgi:hypothetical protein